jgi:putative tricarboxylic transport membrane protein
VRPHRLHIGASAVFTVAVIALIVAAIVSAQEWPADARLVPVTASWMALVAALFNLANELFGRRDPAVGSSDAALELGVADGVARWRAASYFLWLIGFIALIWAIGFIPAIALFIIASMRFGYGEPWPQALGYAGATTIACWLVFHELLVVAWPHALLGDLLPALRAATGFI